MKIRVLDIPLDGHHGLSVPLMIQSEKWKACSLMNMAGLRIKYSCTLCNSVRLCFLVFVKRISGINVHYTTLSLPFDSRLTEVSLELENNM